MAIKSRRNFKTVIGAADLTLTAQAGESILVKDVKIYSPTIVYANFLTQRTSVGFFRVASLLGNHLHFNPGRAAHSHDFYFGTVDAALTGVGAFMENAGEVDTVLSGDGVAADTNYARMVHMSHTPATGMETILGYLRKKGIFNGYPVAEGEVFTVDLITGATAVKVVEYEIYEAGDITSEMENGSKSGSYVYINYGDTGAVLQATAETVLGETNNPTEYPSFPFGGIVPANQKIEVIGILASGVAPAANVTGTATYTDYLKLMKGRTVLFDEDHNGLLYHELFLDPPGAVNMIAEGHAVGGNYTQCDLKEPLMFDPALVFNEGEELSVAWHVIYEGAGSPITEELQEVGVILRLSPME